MLKGLVVAGFSFPARPKEDVKSPRKVPSVALSFHFIGTKAALPAAIFKVKTLASI